jgi:hypothetical protein
MLDRFVGKRPSLAERMAMGRALRNKVPRESHATWRAGKDRADPVAIIEG